MLSQLLSLWGFRATRGYLSGLWNGLEPMTGVRVLFYHGVVALKRDERLERNLHLVSDFESHLKLLRRFRILNLSELEDEAFRPSTRRGAAFVLTFDDGYKNNLLAAELLERYRLPWMLAVSSGAIGNERTIWSVELSLLVLHGEAEALEALETRWPLASREERELAFQTIRNRMKEQPSESRIETMNRIRTQFPAGETERLLERFPSLRMLTWNEVTTLSLAGVEIGSHGRHHEIHHQKQTNELRAQELSVSKAEIEARLGRPCRFFAFPNGNFVAESPREVAAAGYELAMTTVPGSVGDTTNPYLLPRLNPPGSVRSLARTLFWKSGA